MMSLHPSKRLALLQLTNCMPSCNVKTIKQLSDGKTFLSIIETVFPDKTLNLQSEEKQTFHDHEYSKDEGRAMDKDSKMLENDSQKELNSGVESSKETESVINGQESIASQIACESIDVISTAESFEQISIEDKDVISSGDGNSSPPVETVDKKDDDLPNIYEFIECFIDEKYNLQSGWLITYKECMTGNEFELAKVTLFVISEVVRHYVQLNDAVIQTLSHLDMKVQQDLEDCFNLFINERAKITSSDIKKLLSNPASYKVSPSKSSFVTPKRSCSSKYKRSPTSVSPLHDSVYIDSPLKTYFESPIFTKKDIITKEKEIFKTRQTLYEEEIKSSTLQLTVKDLEKKLKNKDKEISNLRSRIKELEEIENLKACENCAILDKSLKETKKKLRKCERLLNENEQKMIDQYEEKLECYKIEWSNHVAKLQFDADKVVSQYKELEADKHDVDFMLLKRELEIERLVEELKELIQKKEISEEKLSAATIEIKKYQECSIRGESIGGVIEKENEELRQRIKQLELIALSKEKVMVDAMVHCTEDIFDCKVSQNSTVSKNELSPIPNICEKTESVIISENLENCPKVCVDKHSSISPGPSVAIPLTLNNSPSIQIDCVETDNSISTGPSDTIPLSLNNHTSTQNDCVGALWQQYNDSVTENESTNGEHLLENCVNKIMSSLQKFETEFPKHNKHIKFTCRANGSNGLVSSPVVKELMEDLKSVKKSLLCLLKDIKNTDVKFQNNNSLSNRSEVMNGKDCDSNLATIFTCDTCLKKKEELPDGVLSSVGQDSAAALLEKIKEFDILNEQHLTTVTSLRHKEKELNAYKKRYILERRENKQNIKCFKDSEIKCQKLHSELKSIKKAECDLKRDVKNEKFILKYHLIEKVEKYNKLEAKYNYLHTYVQSLHEKNKKLEENVIAFSTQNQELIHHSKLLENQIQELGYRPQSEPEQSTNLELRTTAVPHATQGPIEQNGLLIPKTEPLSPTECEASSLNTDIDGSISASALYAKNNLQNPFQLHTADEESFLNHSSIAGLSRNCESEESLHRMQELNRRNTMYVPQYEAYFQNSNYEQSAPNRVGELNRRNTLCLPHLQSCYPAEGVPLNHPNQHSSNYVNIENHEGAKTESQSENEKPAGKKRKASEMKTEDQSSNVMSTPSGKEKKKWPPVSLHQMLKFSGRRSRRAAITRPKPE